MGKIFEKLREIKRLAVADVGDVPGCVIWFFGNEDSADKDLNKLFSIKN
jgi:hypothetical protein